MAREFNGAPTFARGDIVLLFLLDEKGTPKNDLASEASQYHSESAVIVTLRRTSVDGEDVFVYGVHTDDGNVLELTQGCLTASSSLTAWR